MPGASAAAAAAAETRLRLRLPSGCGVSGCCAPGALPCVDASLDDISWLLPGQLREHVPRFSDAPAKNASAPFSPSAVRPVGQVDPRVREIEIRRRRFDVDASGLKVSASARTCAKA